MLLGLLAQLAYVGVSQPFNTVSGDLCKVEAVLRLGTHQTAAVPPSDVAT